MTNDMLRSHVTGIAFNLTLGKTHIAALVRLEEIGAGTRKDLRLGNFITGVNGLLTRGLVIHVNQSVWQITPAGRLVLELLREAGIHQEYAVGAPAEAVAA